MWRSQKIRNRTIFQFFATFRAKMEERHVSWASKLQNSQILKLLRTPYPKKMRTCLYSGNVLELEISMHVLHVHIIFACFESQTQVSDLKCPKIRCTCNTRIEISNSRTVPECKHMRIISGCGNRRNRKISEFCYLHANDTCISFTLAGKVAKSAKVIRFRNFWERHIPKNAYMLIL